jgi:hypothetical protein
MDEPTNIASRRTGMIEAGVLFGIAIDAIRSIKVDHECDLPLLLKTNNSILNPCLVPEMTLGR